MCRWLLVMGGTSGLSSMLATGRSRDRKRPAFWVVSKWNLYSAVLERILSGRVVAAHHLSWNLALVYPTAIQAGIFSWTADSKSNTNFKSSLFVVLSTTFINILRNVTSIVCLFLSLDVHGKPRMYCSLLAYCTARFGRSNFDHQMPPRLPTRSTL
jgi:hypothetical protein